MNNLSFAYPWLGLLALLPLPVYWLLPPYQPPRRGLVVPFLARLAAASGRDAHAGAAVLARSRWRWALLLLCWLAIVTALARPQLIEPPVSRDLPVRDLLLAVDLSGSMETRDFTNADGRVTDRLAAVKAVLDEFLARRQGDRVGLIFFGSAAFVQAPFTEDLEVCRQLLDEAQVRMAGPQTAFGDALGLAINVFERSTVRERVLIALTDGNDTSSQVPPAKAAQIARDKGIVIHTVAVGDPRAAGEDALDEATLEQVATTTGGLYSRANDRQQLESVYRELDKLEQRKVQTLSHRPRRDVYWWPLAAALLLSMASFAISLLPAALQRRQRPADATLAALSPLSLASLPLLPHIIRPVWLLALLPAALLWWQLQRRTDPDRVWHDIVAPHLRAHLLRGDDQRSRFSPVHCLGLAWLLACLAIAGPSWTRVPSPFAEDTATMAIVVRVAPSMQTGDLQPSRLQRATHKIHDLLQARGSARTALIAYAGSAHLVMPPTRDGGIIDTFAGALEPAIMPREGDDAAAALALAQQTLARAGGGSILWLTDSVAPEQAAALGAWREQTGTPLYLWPPLLPGAELDTLRAAASPAGARLVRLSADDSDVQALAGAADFTGTTDPDGSARWAETGYWLTPALALCVLLFFRRGWLLPAMGSR